MKLVKNIAGYVGIAFMPIIYPMTIIGDKLIDRRTDQFEQRLAFLYFILGCLLDAAILLILGLTYILWKSI